MQHAGQGCLPRTRSGEYRSRIASAFRINTTSMSPIDTRTGLPFLGFGLRLRREYVSSALSGQPDVDWFEIISENHMDDSGDDLDDLLKIRADYPLVMHGISLGIGSPWPLDRGYIQKLKALIDRVRPAWISDHLCWRGADDMHGSLLPLPYSEEMLEHVVARIQRVQDMLGGRILLENVPPERFDGRPEIPEADFLTEVASRSGSLILVDVSNLLNSTLNTGISADDYLGKLSPSHVQQIHLSGAIALCDSTGEHSGASGDPIWSLYTRILEKFGAVSTMIEREDTIAPLNEMVQEVSKARCSANTILSARC